jgi:hypothetical protein
LFCFTPCVVWAYCSSNYELLCSSFPVILYQGLNENSPTLAWLSNQISVGLFFCSYYSAAEAAVLPFFGKLFLWKGGRRFSFKIKWHDTYAPTRISPHFVRVIRRRWLPHLNMKSLSAVRQHHGRSYNFIFEIKGSPPLAVTTTSGTN